MCWQYLLGLSVTGRSTIGVGLCGLRSAATARLFLPEDRGKMTVADVLAVSAGPERDRAIDDWCRSVWTAFSGNRQTIFTRGSGQDDGCRCAGSICWA